MLRHRYYHRPILANPWPDAVNCDGSGSCRLYRNTAATAAANRLYAKGGVAQRDGDVVAALRHYHAAVEAQPSHLQAITALAYLYDRPKGGRPSLQAEAQVWFEEIVRLFPVHTGERVRRGQGAGDGMVGCSLGGESICYGGWGGVGGGAGPTLGT